MTIVLAVSMILDVSMIFAVFMNLVDVVFLSLFYRTLEGWALSSLLSPGFRPPREALLCRFDRTLVDWSLLLLLSLEPCCPKVLSLEPCAPRFCVPQGLVPQWKLGRRWWCRARKRVFFLGAGCSEVFVFLRVSSPKGSWGGIDDAALASGCFSLELVAPRFLCSSGFCPPREAGAASIMLRLPAGVGWRRRSNIGPYFNCRRQYCTTNEGRCDLMPLHSSPCTGEESGR